MKKEKDSSRSKVRIFYAEIDGNDDAVEALVQAFSRATQPPSRLVKSIAIRAPGPEQIGMERSEIEGAEEEFGEVDAREDEGEAADEPSSKSPRRPRKTLSYQIVHDINFRPEGRPSLKDFYSGKLPSDSQEQVTLFVYYLEKILNCDSIGWNHIYSAYKDVGTKSPIDIPKITRNAAARKGRINCSDTSNLRITVAGENYVEHDLPAKGTK